MKTIINTFKYGSSRIKKDLLLTILCGILAVSFGIAAIIVKSMLLFFVTVIFIFITISMVQTFGIHSTDSELGAQMVKAGSLGKNEKNSNEKKLDSKEASKVIDSSDNNVEAIQNVDDGGIKNNAEGLFAKIISNLKDIVKKDKNSEKENNKTALKNDKKKNKGIGLKEKHSDRDNNTNEQTDMVGMDINQVVNKADTKEQSINIDDNDILTETDINEIDDEADEENEEVIEQATEEDIVSYSKVKLKKTLHKYKVKRDHRTVLIDYCEKLKIKQTPAFIWVVKKEFHMLLIEHEPRHLIFPIYAMRNIKYHKKQLANPDIDYAFLKTKSLISDMFIDLEPDYLHSTVIDDMSAYKNLYAIGPDIRFTNKSAKHLFDLLNVEFILEDKVTSSAKVNIYFKDAYKANILLRDNVIDANGYADKISAILGDMAISTMSYNEFKETLNLMIKNKLITQEFATYYMDLRDKNKR